MALERVLYEQQLPASEWTIPGPDHPSALLGADWKAYARSMLPMVCPAEPDRFAPNMYAFRDGLPWTHGVDGPVHAPGESSDGADDPCWGEPVTRVLLEEKNINELRHWALAREDQAIQVTDLLIHTDVGELTKTDYRTLTGDQIVRLGPVWEKLCQQTRSRNIVIGYLKARKKDRTLLPEHLAALAETIGQIARENLNEAEILVNGPFPRGICMTREHWIPLVNVLLARPHKRRVVALDFPEGKPAVLPLSLSLTDPWRKEFFAQECTETVRAFREHAGIEVDQEHAELIRRLSIPEQFFLRLVLKRYRSAPAAVLDGIARGFLHAEIFKRGGEARGFQPMLHLRPRPDGSFDIVRTLAASTSIQAWKTLQEAGYHDLEPFLASHKVKSKTMRTRAGSDSIVRVTTPYCGPSLADLLRFLAHYRQAHPFLLDLIHRSLTAANALAIKGRHNNLKSQNVTVEFWNRAQYERYEGCLEGRDPAYIHFDPFLAMNDPATWVPVIHLIDLEKVAFASHTVEDIDPSPHRIRVPSE